MPSVLLVSCSKKSKQEGRGLCIPRPTDIAQALFLSFFSSPLFFLLFFSPPFIFLPSSYSFLPLLLLFLPLLLLPFSLLPLLVCLPILPPCLAIYPPICLITMPTGQHGGCLCAMPPRFQVLDPFHSGKSFQVETAPCLTEPPPR